MDESKRERGLVGGEATGFADWFGANPLNTSSVCHGN